MAERTGISSLVKAFTIISGIVAVNDVINRKKSIDEARARHDQTKLHLVKIETGINNINAKLSDK
jgi:hypothetical protein